MSFPTHNMSSGAEYSGRPTRTIKQSQKATEAINAGENIPGISSSSISRPAFTHSLNVLSTRYTGPTASSPTMSPGCAVATKGSANKGMLVPSFAPEKFLIYNWENPRPTNFTELSEPRKRWKRGVDQQERSGDVDDGSDDWYDFNGRRDDYDDGRGDGFAMEYAVASSFLKRAKRAFWASESWVIFEIQERTFNSEAQARAEPDSRKRELLMECMLDNDVRLAVFDALKQRLCEEIWLQPYDFSPAVRRLSRPGPDSRMPTPSPMIDPYEEQARRPPIAEEMERGIHGWSIAEGWSMYESPLRPGANVEQPLYEGEREPPNGMRNFMRDMREQANAEARNVAQRRVQPTPREGGRIGNIGVNGVIPMSIAEEIASRELDFSTSDEEDD